MGLAASLGVGAVVVTSGLDVADGLTVGVNEGVADGVTDGVVVGVIVCVTVGAGVDVRFAGVGETVMVTTVVGDGIGVAVGSGNCCVPSLETVPA